MTRSSVSKILRSKLKKSEDRRPETEDGSLKIVHTFAEYQNAK